jgi:hypothetical protein
MLEAPTLKEIEEYRKTHSNTLCCILFAPKFSKTGFADIVQRFGYLDHRFGQYLNVFCAGYGAYWNDEYAPDREDVGITKYDSKDNTKLDWQFSQILFANFVDELEKITSWKYSGGSELIVLGENSGFANCIILKIDEMVQDNIINQPAEILEALIQYSRVQEGSLSEFSKSGIRKQASDAVLDSILHYLPKPFEELRDIWKKGKHYALVDLEK